MPRILRAGLLVSSAAWVMACAGVATTPPPGIVGGPSASTAVFPVPSATDPAPTPNEGPQGASFEGVPTACVGLGEQDCRRVAAHVATLLTAAGPAVRYVQVGPFRCPDERPCATTLAARREGEVILEFRVAASAFLVKVNGGALDTQPLDVFGVHLAPTTLPPLPAAAQPFTLGHCGLWSGIDVGGSWWDPVGVVDYDHGDAINAAAGTIAPVGPGRAVFTSKSGFTVQLVRRDGPKFLPLCS